MIGRSGLITAPFLVKKLSAILCIFYFELSTANGKDRYRVIILGLKSI